MSQNKISTVLRVLADVILLTGLYIAFAGRLTWRDVLAGLIVAAATLAAVGLVFDDYYRSVSFSLRYISYAALLLYHMMRNAVWVAGLIFSKNVFVKCVRHKSGLRNEQLRGMLANAVTLTPGAATAELTGDILEIMCLNTERETGGTEIAAKLERPLLRMERERRR